MARDKIMIVDNEMEIIQLIKLYLSKEGFDVVWTTDSSQALVLFSEENPDLVLLDIVMPGVNGLELCNDIRQLSNVPILFVSCKSHDNDKVLGLGIGGDDYITKPFSPIELVARVKAHLRRNNLVVPPSANDNTVIVGEIAIDIFSHVACLRGEPLHLTAKEFEILWLMIQYPNRVFTPQQIFNSLWDNYGYEDDVRTIMVHISNLRKKIQPEPNSPKYIQTIRGVGYKLVNPFEG